MATTTVMSPVGTSCLVASHRREDAAVASLVAAWSAQQMETDVIASRALETANAALEASEARNAALEKEIALARSALADRENVYRVELEASHRERATLEARVTTLDARVSGLEKGLEAKEAAKRAVAARVAKLLEPAAGRPLCGLSGVHWLHFAFLPAIGEAQKYLKDEY